MFAESLTAAACEIPSHLLSLAQKAEFWIVHICCNLCFVMTWARKVRELDPDPFWTHKTQKFTPYFLLKIQQCHYAFKYLLQQRWVLPRHVFKVEAGCYDSPGHPITPRPQLSLWDIGQWYISHKTMGLWDYGTHWTHYSNLSIWQLCFECWKYLEIESANF